MSLYPVVVYSVDTVVNNRDPHHCNIHLIWTCRSGLDLRLNFSVDQQTT